MTHDSARILLIDDDTDILELVSHHLIVNGFVVSCVENGEDAIEILRAEPFDVILCDEVMPGMQGTEVLARSLMHRIETPFLMVTGFGEGETVRKALRLGAFDFIDKPIKLDELLKCVYRAAEFSRRLRNAKMESKQLNGDIVDQDKIERDRRVASLLRLVNSNRRKTG